MTKFTSNNIKKALINNYRYKKQYAYVATEAGIFNADVLTCGSDNKFIEFEVKTSYADLKKDFAKKKHKIYAKANSSLKPAMCTPTHFYFVIPEELLDKCKELVVSYPKYGIIVYYGRGELFTRKRAKPLHSENSSVWVNKFKKIIVARMSSEIAIMWNKYK